MNEFSSIKERFVDNFSEREFINLDKSKRAYFKIKSALAKPLKLVLFYGKPGSGKSFLLAKLAEDLRTERVIYLAAPHQKEASFFKELYEQIYALDPAALGFATVGDDAATPPDASEKASRPEDLAPGANADSAALSATDSAVSQTSPDAPKKASRPEDLASGAKSVNVAANADSAAANADSVGAPQTSPDALEKPNRPEDLAQQTSAGPVLGHRCTTAATTAPAEIPADYDAFLAATDAAYLRANPVAIMLDEAQLYPAELIEKIRLLSDTRCFKFLFTVHQTAAGEDILAQEHFSTRIWESIALGESSEAEIAHYVAKKIPLARFFEPGEMALLAQLCAGNLRTLNMLLYSVFELFEYYESERPSRLAEPGCKRKIIEMAALAKGLLHA